MSSLTDVGQVSVRVSRDLRVIGTISEDLCYGFFFASILLGVCERAIGKATAAPFVYNINVGTNDLAPRVLAYFMSY